MSHKSIQELSAEEIDQTFRTNVFAMFYLCKFAEPHLKPGSTVVNTTSINAYKPSPGLLAYAATKGAIQNFTAALGQLWAEKGIRVNCVAPGPVWTPLIPSTMPPEHVKEFGQDVPLKRACTTCRACTRLCVACIAGIELYDKLYYTGYRRFTHYLIYFCQLKSYGEFYLNILRRVVDGNSFDVSANSGEERIII